MSKSKLIICPNEEKNKILLSLSNDKDIHPIKFMNKREYLSNYYFSYDDEAIYYLMNKYNLNIDVCKVYLNNLYVIDINKNYKNDKLNYLKDLIITDGVISPNFDRQILEYSINIGNNIKEIDWRIE